MGRIILTLALAWFAGFLAADRASAQTSPVVVELFTSQGCNSCPPADELLGRLADRDDVVALSLHVDYWDYLGWRDIFGLPAHTQRQRDYAAYLGERMVYTPQVVVDGREGMVGSHAHKVEAAIKARSGAKAEAAVELRLVGDRVVAAIQPLSGKAKGQVLMAWFTRAESVEIRAGENRGRRIVYNNVVKGWAELGRYKGDAVELSAPKPMTADGVAVMVQSRRDGRIIAAGRLALR